MFVETVNVLSTGVGVIEVSKKLFPTFERVFKRLKNGDLKIAIFGAGGTGKTTLGQLLAGSYELSDLPTYRESISMEKYRLDSDSIGSIVVAPGQERREDTWDDLLLSLASGKVKLIIHVVAWGHHSFGELSYKEHPLYKMGMSTDEFIAVYTAERRQRELDVLKKLEPHLSMANQKKTVMITIVSKQDLWWNDRDRVKDHYANGAYEQIIQGIRNKIGSANFIHEYCSASLVMDNFLSGASEMLVPTTGGYDQRLKSANLKNFLSAIENLLDISLNAQEP
jgi:ethanolamine utilization protein EutP (predicted NTPase)